MSEQETLCGLNIDEMALKPKYQFCTSKQQMVGKITIPLSEKMQQKRIKRKGKYDSNDELATHALNAMLYGLSTFWKQLVGFHFTGNSFCAKSVAEWVVEIIKKAQSIGLKVLLFSMDSGPQNIAV